MKIAIVEDNPASAEKLRGYLRQYGEENQKEFDITLFGDAVSFLDRYSPFDMVFMDIELPGMDGMEAARRLREVDRQAILLFVTNMARFAVKGYEVDAMDYLVKPVQYGSFSLKLRRALARWEQTSETILVSQPNGFQRLLLREIRYLEVSSHKLIYHTTGGGRGKAAQQGISALQQVLSGQLQACGVGAGQRSGAHRRGAAAHQPAPEKELYGRAGRRHGV